MNDMSTEPMPSYGNGNLITYAGGNDKWLKLFNPCQLLTLVKLIREAGKKIEKRPTKFMFDTNIFDMILDGKLEVPEGYEYYVTHIQYDEIINMPETKKEKREQLLKLFKVIPMELVLTEGFVINVSRIGSSKLMDDEDGKLYDDMLKKLQELDRKKGRKKSLENQIRDVLILLTCLKNNITLVTEDKPLRNLAHEYNVKALSLSDFQQLGF